MNRSTNRWVSGDRKGRSSPASIGTLGTRLLVEPSGTEPAPIRQRAVGLAYSLALHRRVANGDQVLVLQGHDPFSVWRLPKPQAIALFPPETSLGRTLRVFPQAVHSYYPSEESTEEGLAVITTGVTFLRAVQSWWQEYDPESASDHQ